jgi:ADP-heptose:LPS heptosyltransferase
MEAVEVRQKCRWVVVGAAGDRAAAGEVSTGFSGRIENLAGKTSLEELLALLRGCSALLTNDTGTMHLADLLGVPLVAIFGSTEPALTGPRNRHSVVLRHHVECSPCFLRTCPLDFRCMEGVRASDAGSALLGLLTSIATPIVPPPPADTSQS